MSSYLGLILVLLTFGGPSWAQNCKTDAELVRAGFQVHTSSQFAAIESQLKLDLEKNKADFVVDMTSRMLAEATLRPVEVISHDRLATPQEVMFGDILTILDLETGRFSEWRWFDGKKKHVVYNSEFQKCAMGLIPYATNALF